MSASGEVTAGPGLLARVARGDGPAMEACIAAYGPLVWGLVLRRVAERTAAEDLTQEIFTEIWKNAARYDEKIASEAGFIAMIARRRAIDYLRKQQRLPEMRGLTAVEDFAAEAETPGAALDREGLWKALEPLADETRHLFDLHFERGMSHREISAETGLPLGSVKTRLRRGLLEARGLVKRFRAGMNLSPTMQR